MKAQKTNPETSQTAPFQSQLRSSLWHRVFKETRSRILFLYTVLILLLTALSVPIFRALLFHEIDQRVRADLREERKAVLSAYAQWDSVPDQTVQDLKAFSESFFTAFRPADDNFHVVLIDGEFFISNPRTLPKPLRPGSDVFQQWQTVVTFSRGFEISRDPDIGKLLYKADPLMLDGVQRGVHVVGHSAASDRREVLVGVSLFMRTLMGVVTLSLVLAWVGSGRLMVPIRALASTARSIHESDLGRRIPPVEGYGELAELTNTFNAMMDRIQVAFDSQRDFINDAGHELRTPITIIRGHLELLGDDPKERQETVELLLDELDRMGRLVNDMILLAKAERRDFLESELLEADALAETLFAKAQTLAPRNWVLTIETRVRLVGDRRQLTGALLNLLSNAAQHTTPEDTIELGCRLLPRSPLKALPEKAAVGSSIASLSPSRLKLGKSKSSEAETLRKQAAPQQIQFWVRDTGRGISPEDQQRIFSRFARGRGYQRQSDGAGLGLAIVRAIAEAHGGSVSLVSELGQGSVFQLNLPID